MTERWGDRYVSEDTGLIVSALRDIEEVLLRIAEALEARNETRAAIHTEGEAQ